MGFLLGLLVSAMSMVSGTLDLTATKTQGGKNLQETPNELRFYIEHSHELLITPPRSGGVQGF